MARTKRDRILLSDAVVAALVNAGATAGMIEAARAAACEEYEAHLVKEAARQRRQRAARRSSGTRPHSWIESRVMASR